MNCELCGEILDEGNTILKRHTLRAGCIKALKAAIRKLTKELYDANQVIDIARPFWMSRAKEAEADNERLRAALEAIASCKSNFPGDVVDIAQQALGLLNNKHKRS